MRTGHKRNWRLLALLMVTVVVSLGIIAWYFQSLSRSSQELQRLGEDVVAAVNDQDFARLEKLVGNTVAVETIRGDVGNEPVRLGQVQASRSGNQYFTVIVESVPEKEIFVYVSKKESGAWWVNVP